LHPTAGIYDHRWWKRDRSYDLPGILKFRRQVLSSMVRPKNIDVRPQARKSYHPGFLASPHSRMMFMYADGKVYVLLLAQAQ
jgi:hypothetical protein